MREVRRNKMFIVAEAAQQGSTGENHHDAQFGRGSGLCFWNYSAPEGLNHPIPLSENGVAGSSPVARSSQTILIRSAGACKNLQCQSGVCQKEPQ